VTGQAYLLNFSRASLLELPSEISRLGEPFSARRFVSGGVEAPHTRRPVR
jgi:hypothetical protein